MQNDQELYAGGLGTSLGQDTTYRFLSPSDMPDGENWIDLAQDDDQWKVILSTVMSL
jgi:hypothetical protein